MLLRPKTNTNCAQCGTHNSNPLLAIDVDGSVYPCDYFWGNQDFKVGDIFSNSLDEIASSDMNFRNSQGVKDIPECSPCDWKQFCGGGCAGSVQVLDKPGEHCKYTQAMLTYVARKLPVLHKQGLIKKILER